VVDSYEQCNEHLGSIKGGEFLDKLNGNELLKDSTPQNQSVKTPINERICIRT